MEGGIFSPAPEDTALALLGGNQGWKSPLCERHKAKHWELLESLQDEEGWCEQTWGCVILAWLACRRGTLILFPGFWQSQEKYADDVFQKYIPPSAEGTECGEDAIIQQEGWMQPGSLLPRVKTLRKQQINFCSVCSTPIHNWQQEQEG